MNRTKKLADALNLRYTDETPTSVREHIGNSSRLLTVCPIEEACASCPQHRPTCLKNNTRDARLLGLTRICCPRQFVNEDTAHFKEDDE